MQIGCSSITGCKAMMSSLSYVQEVPFEVYGFLFEELVGDEKSTAEDLDFTLEAIDSAIKGGIDFKNKFNLAGYVHNARVNEKMSKQRKAKKVLRIRNAGEDADDEDVYGVREDTLSDGTNFYEDLILEEELRYTLIKLKQLYDEFLFEYEVDLWGCIENATKNIPVAQEVLKKVCEEDAQISEIVYILLSSNRSIQELRDFYETL